MAPVPTNLSARSGTTAGRVSARATAGRRATLLACMILITACGGSGTAAPSGGPTALRAAASVPGGDWPTFDYNPQRTGVGPANTGITARNVRTLQARRVHLDGTVDSSPIELHGISAGGRVRDLVVVTTSYGHTIAIDAANGQIVWEFVSPGTARVQGTRQITTATPVADPDRRNVYAASPDGLIHKLSLSSGAQVVSANWPVRVTNDPGREKIPAALTSPGAR